MHSERIIHAVVRRIGANNGVAVHNAATTVNVFITGKNFFDIFHREGQGKPVFRLIHTVCVHHKANDFVTVHTDIGIRAVIQVVGFCPAEAFGIVFSDVQRLRRRINFIQTLHVPVECIVLWVRKQHPVAFLMFIPFTQLSQIVAHEVELFTGVGVHVGIQ